MRNPDLVEPYAVDVNNVEMLILSGGEDLEDCMGEILRGRLQLASAEDLNGD